MHRGGDHVHCGHDRVEYGGDHPICFDFADHSGQLATLVGRELNQPVGDHQRPPGATRNAGSREVVHRSSHILMWYILTGADVID